MLSKLKQLFKRGERSPKLEPRLDDEADLSWLDPPTDPLDVAAWDRYWIEQVRHGLGPPLFDMFCDDRNLVQVMNTEGMNSVLCAGNGISQEPRALAQAGFQVVALDLSPRAVEIARGFKFPTDGFEYFCEPGMRRSGGHVDFAVGDILDPAVCPGPFDVIIERRTAQIFFNHDMGSVLGALAERLGQDGIFLSHCHDGAWKPPAEPRHFTKSWFQQKRWTIWNGSPGRKPPGRVGWLFTSTG
jgi:SAM-dependent methyltransferase